MNKEERLRMGVSDGLLRINVGLEDVRDIISDIDQALSAAGFEIIHEKKHTIGFDFVSPNAYLIWGPLCKIAEEKNASVEFFLSF